MVRFRHLWTKDKVLPTMTDAEPDGEFEDYNPLHPLSSVEMALVTQGWEKEPHAHSQAQLMLSLRGLISCEIESGLWLVPSQHALWIPPGIPHSVRCVGAVELTCLFIDGGLIGGLPDQVRTLAITPLLRELILAVSRLPALYDETGPAAPLIQTMMNELAAAPVERQHMPLPTDRRLRKIADAWSADPAARATVGNWAAHVGMSERTLSRLVLHETGMPFGRWRQQFQIMMALEQLTRGVPVQVVATDLGYESPSAFISMFRKALGESPSRYLARHSPKPAR
jgi:AraC-like DNA-binding protein/mannose-6-phosphate isomerase-like protein (cupin superfamily)